ncbi:DddA-like double-stranded DNA deaminase toxin [Prauserella cavernicola]|uniref:Uncharacterized protein n=1 Tax=Prauserella cavernicola TaxID=2800127 RepID=A0A934V535_9PSEU|nr:DddA-like double-stranded DNA deaminase toxin [Prauserella cavernicola]MBK1786042.1 hypothetical protein [Prauserella cavernicola]
MSVEELAAAVRRALDLLVQARADAEHAAGLTGEARDIYGAVLYGASDPEAAQLPAIAAQFVDEVSSLHGPLQLVDESLRAYLHELGAAGPEPGAPARRPEPTAAATPRIARPEPEVAASDGSRYPPEAAWCAEMLPRRVRTGEGSDRTVGYVGGSFDRYVSGHDGTWSETIRQRAATLGFSPTNAKFLSAHVEMKVAAKMVLDGREHTELTVNNQPCRGRSPISPGCHEALPRYLPKGCTLTVNGTTQDGRPFRHTYEGQA